MSHGLVTVPAVAASDVRTWVEIVDRLTDFEALRPQWDELLNASAANRPFLTWEWLFAWWTSLRGRSRLKLFVVRSGGQLVAVAPLRVTGGGLTWFSSLEFLGTGFAGSDYLDLIVRRGFEAEALAALAGSIESEGLALRLTHLPPASLASRLARRLTANGWTSRETQSGVCPLIRLAGHTWDSYLASRGPAHRANVRRRLRAASALDVRFERVASASQRIDVLQALAAFHEERFTGSKSSTAFRTPELQAFHRDATAGGLDAGWLRLYALHLNGDLAGAMYAFSYDRRFYFYQHGYDERYQKHSPGLLLIAMTIQAAIDEGAIEFDFLYGTESYKALWADDVRSLGRLDLFPARFGGRMHRRGVDAETTLRALARRLRSGDSHVG